MDMTQWCFSLSFLTCPVVRAKFGKEGVREVKSLSVTSQFTVESRIDRAENTWGLGWEMDIQRFIVNDIAKKQNKTKKNKK